MKVHKTDDFYGSDWRGHHDAFAWTRDLLESAGAIANAHCDNLVLHRPGECHYCDIYADTAQAVRTKLRIPFAGEIGAPETIFRPAETVTRWSGNVGVKKGELHSHMGATYVVGEAEQPCRLPPPGWWCSRVAGHEGPCAARPLERRDPSGE